MRDLDKELLEGYLWGRLSEEERKQFEQARASDPEFAALVEEEESLRTFLQAQKDRERVRNATDALGKEFFPTMRRSSPGIRRFLGPITIAATVLIAALLVWFWAFPDSPQSLYQAFAVHDALDLSERDGPGSFAEVEQLFNRGDYAAAIPSLVALQAEDKTDLEVEKALGIAYLESGQLEQALAIFTSLAVTDSAYQQDAVWYTALTYLRMENKEEAAAWLKKIERGSRWYPSSRKLSRRL